MRGIAFVVLALLMTAGAAEAKPAKVGHEVAQKVAQKIAQKVERISPNPWEKQIGYAQAVRHGDRLIISGVVADGPDMAAQMKAVYSEIDGILTAQGLTSKSVIKETIYTRDIEAVKANIALRKTFYVDDAYPAATWVQIDRLFEPQFLLEVEIEAVF